MIKHLRENNETYCRHLFFATRVGIFLLLAGTVFLLHGLLPVKSIPTKFNFEAIIKKLSTWNDYTRERLET